MTSSRPRDRAPEGLLRRSGSGRLAARVESELLAISRRRLGRRYEDARRRARRTPGRASEHPPRAAPARHASCPTSGTLGTSGPDAVSKADRKLPGGRSAPAHARAPTRLGVPARGYAGWPATRNRRTGRDGVNDRTHGPHAGSRGATSARSRTSCASTRATSGASRTTSRATGRWPTTRHAGGVPACVPVPLRGFRGGPKFTSWLFRIARNCAMDQIKARNVYVERVTPDRRDARPTRRRAWSCTPRSMRSRPSTASRSCSSRCSGCRTRRRPTCSACVWGRSRAVCTGRAERMMDALEVEEEAR